MGHKNIIALCLFLTIAAASIGHISDCGLNIFRLREGELAGAQTQDHEAVAANRFFWLFVAILISISLTTFITSLKVFISTINPVAVEILNCLFTFKYPDGRASYIFTVYLVLYGAGLTCLVVGANQRGVLRELEQYPEQYKSYHILIHAYPYYFLILASLVLTCGRRPQAEGPHYRKEMVEPTCLVMLAFFVLKFRADHVGILSLQTMDAARKHAFYKEDMGTFDALIIAAYSLSALTASTAILDLTLDIDGKE